MTRALVVIGSAFLAAALLSACSELGPSIPGTKQQPGGPAPSGTSVATAGHTSPVPQVSRASNATAAQLGVQIYWHDVNDLYAAKSNADKLLDYVLGLGANSVAISFPIYTDGSRPTKVYTKAGVTPTPASLRVIIGEAKMRGLRVMLRPIIDEKNIKDNRGSWRGSIQPRNLTTWFNSYIHTLSPYLAAAQAAHADTFTLGSELDSLVKASQWRTVEASASAIFGGRLAYTDNWGAWATDRPGVPGAEPGVDAYPILKVNDQSTVAQITAAWVKWLRHHPDGLTDTVVQEVGIAATPGAYKEPAAWATTGDTVAPQIQAKWFAGACAAIRQMHMAGIYFWSLDAWQDPAKGNTYTAGSFIGRGDSAIKACFAQSWPTQ